MEAHDDRDGRGTRADRVGDAWFAEVRELARQRDAVLLAHNYQLPEIQDVADHTGDSLALSRIAAESSASTIVFCGVHFMAETAKILAPDKTVLIPDAAPAARSPTRSPPTSCARGRPSTPAPSSSSYVNTTAAVKAETDVCCTSSATPWRWWPRSRPTGRCCSCPTSSSARTSAGPPGRENMHVWAGECHVHAGINGAELAAQVDAHPDAELFVHPECGCATSRALPGRQRARCPADRVKILSTGGMLDAARAARSARRRCWSPPRSACCTSCAAAAPEIDFRAVNDRASCRYMKMITPETLLRALRDGTRRGARRPRAGRPRPRGGAADDRDRHARAVASERRWEAGADLVVVGTGVAGLTAALDAAAAGLRVVVVTKDAADAGSTRWAQGGVAVVVGDVPGDSVDAARRRHPHRGRRPVRRRGRRLDPDATARPRWPGCGRAAPCSTRPRAARWRAPARAATRRSG